MGSKEPSGDNGAEDDAYGKEKKWVRRRRKKRER